MRRISLALVTILCLCIVVYAKPQYLNHPGNEYIILGSCTATAQLIRKHRNKEPLGADLMTTVDYTSEEFASSTTANIEMQKSDVHDIKTTRIPTMYPKHPPLKTSDNHKYYFQSDERPSGKILGRQSYTKSGTDTPLRTVNVEAIYKDRPLLFKKREPLPELRRDVLFGRKETSAFIVIKSSE
ncbi:uncharacterized protein LOC105697525 [Orussus abietinus]|uniref:uncharacterized protein LOC105697525 n=1 Tax=Orussus abietinus TaxID=222816 RepID=UPI0006252FC1|nr:uncharacterized protein LOC105697525 [Orussus abietinus]